MADRQHPGPKWISCTMLRGYTRRGLLFMDNAAAKMGLRMSRRPPLFYRTGKTVRRALVAGVMLAITGCSGGPMDRPFITLAATPSTYVVELYGSLLVNGRYGGKAERYQAAVEAADRHCAQYSKTARLVGDTEGSFGDRRRVSFSCV